MDKILFKKNSFYYRSTFKILIELSKGSSHNNRTSLVFKWGRRTIKDDGKDNNNQWKSKLR